MFPGAHARIDYNEAGEPVGWDYPSEDDPYSEVDLDDYDYDPDYDDTRYDRDTDENYNPEDDAPDDSWLDSEYESRFEVDEG